MTVTIGGLPCANVTVIDNATLTSFQCLAPPGPGFGDVQLQVAIFGSGGGSMQFLYDPPKVTRVVGTPCDAEALCPIQVGQCPTGVLWSSEARDPFCCWAP